MQTNHHVAERFAQNNADILEDKGDGPLFTLAGSSLRADHLRDALAALPAASKLETTVDALNAPDVLNDDTVQQMAFHPASGRIYLRRKA